MKHHVLSKWPSGNCPLFLSLASCCLLLVLSGCGFHLRGKEKPTLSDEFAVMRVHVVNSVVPGDLLRTEMKQVLVQAGVVIAEVDGARVLNLNLYDERSSSRVLTVDSNRNVSEFLLRYQLEFDLTDGSGKKLRSRQAVTLQRTFTFDRLNVLAMEREMQEIRDQMRREAAQQIIRRLAAQEF